MKIIIDAFGGDNAPQEIVKGGVKAINENSGFGIIFTGKKDKIEEILSTLSYDKSRVEIIDCDQIITNDESPTVAIRKKANSSLVVALKNLKENDEIGGMVSAGSTGAVLAGGLLKVGRIKGISRPALAPVLPTVKDTNVLLLDCGANVDCKPLNLCHFAIMGSGYMSALYGIDKPRVALLSNGTEDKKGSELCHETFPLLKELDCINFVGNMEAREILSANVDVVVSDGFAGNIALKSLEGAVGSVLSMMKEGIMSSFKAKMGYLLMKKTFKELKGKLDYNKKGGAPFLGIEKIIIKSHGSSKADSIAGSILQAKQMYENDLTGKIKKMLERAGLNAAAQKDGE